MTDKQEALNYWFTSAINDLQVAQSLFEKKHYSWCLFLLHICIEKTFKGLLVTQDKPLVFTHDLLLLVEKLGLNLPDNLFSDLEEINSFNLETRYDSYKLEFYNKANLEYTKTWKIKAEEILSWLEQHK